MTLEEEHIQIRHTKNTIFVKKLVKFAKLSFVLGGRT